MYFPLYYKKTILLMYTFLTSAATISAIPIIKSPYDSHNCCISCGYEYCDTLMECVRPWEVECPKLINPFSARSSITDDTPKALVAPLVLNKNIDDKY